MGNKKFDPEPEVYQDWRHRHLISLRELIAQREKQGRTKDDEYEKLIKRLKDFEELDDWVVSLWSQSNLIVDVLELLEQDLNTGTRKVSFETIQKLKSIQPYLTDVRPPACDTDTTTHS